jgi:hypothetical protein
MSETQQAQPEKTADEMEMEAYRSIPLLDRQANFWSLNLAAVAMGIGTESFWIGAGTFFALFYLSGAMAREMTQHRYLTKPKV